MARGSNLGLERSKQCVKSCGSPCIISSHLGTYTIQGILHRSHETGKKGNLWVKWLNAVLSPSFIIKNSLGFFVCPGGFSFSMPSPKKEKEGPPCQVFSSISGLTRFRNFRRFLSLEFEFECLTHLF